MPETPPSEKDPIFSESLSLLLMISALLLMLTLLWSIYDEALGQRPWKGYQDRFVRSYRAFLDQVIPKQAEREQQIRQSPEYQNLERQLKNAEDAAQNEVAQITGETRLLTEQIAALNKVFQGARGEISALTYRLETASGEGAKRSLQQRIERVRQRAINATLPTGTNGNARKQFQYPELEQELNQLKARKAQLQTQLVQLQKPAGEIRKEMQTYLQDHLGGLTADQMQGLLRQTESFRIEIKQIHVADIDLVDRCESCHVGIRQPLVLTKADLGGESAFTSHPKKELLQIHYPERFGCTLCHNGNGRATTAVEKAHGDYEHWLWPLYGRDNMEAGCQQCHRKDLYLSYADVLSRGKYLFDHRGCVGCHRFQRYHTEG